MPAIRRREGGYAGLCSIVCGQQLSTASAAAIRARLFAAFDPFHHDTVRLARGDKLARLGLSRPKIKSIKEIGKAIAKGHIDLDAVAAMEADQAHAALTALHGIGPWTADIYLLFCLGNADAWPAGDLALQEAARIAFGLKKRPDAKAMVKLAEQWRPWRGVAAHLLWAYYHVVKRREGAPVQANLARRDEKAKSEKRTERRMAGELDGPRLEPPSGQAKRLVVFLHGYGADGNDLIDIGRAWQGLLAGHRVRVAARARAVRPGADRPAVVSALHPRAERALGRRQQGRPRAGALPRRRARAPQAAAVGAGAGRLQPGHHDGAARRLAPRRRRPPPSSAIPASSCCRTRPSPTPSLGEIKSRPPVLLIHGDQDDLIPAQALFQSAQALAALEVPVEWHLSEGIGHGIDQEGLRHGGEFLARRFGLRA